MTPLQQSLDTFQPTPKERFGVTGYRFFLVAVVLQASFPGQFANAQPLPGSNAPVLTDTPPNFLTDRAFEDALAESISLAWQGQNLRDGLQKLSKTKQLSIILDRRIDPSQQLTLQIQKRTLKTVLKVIATEARADISVLGNTVYVGPARIASRLRTVEEIVASQLATTISVDASPQTRRRFELLKRQTLNWPDLTTPRELLNEVASHYALKIESVNLVPHDLWGQATLPSGSATQLLLTILAQFNLSFEWTESRDGIRLVDMPLDPRIEKQFTLKRGAEQTILSEITRRMPDLEPKVTARRITVVGTVEQIETVEAIIYPERQPNNTRPNQRKVAEGVTVFTFEATAPLGTFMATLEKQSGFMFQYDPKAFKQADIRLDQRIFLEAKKLTAKEVFDKMFIPQNIAYKVDGKTVQLTPASR
mgnify:FL=1